jgi:TatA/E family protein of Tat protein translocase
MFGLGLGEILVIFIIALVFVGPKRLPELARGLGKGIFEFQKAMQSMKDELNKSETPKFGEPQENAQETQQIAQVTPPKDDSTHSNS